MQDQKIHEERIENLKKWWHENNKLVISVIVIGLCSIFGWRNWQENLVVQTQDASDLYEQLVTEIGKAESAEQGQAITKIADQLTRDYQATPYSTLSSLLMAREAVDKDDIDNAIKHLQRALENTDNDEFTHLVRLRLARLLSVKGDLDEALSLVEEGSVDEGRFSPIYLELRGDILLQQGNVESAQMAYEKALLAEAISESWQSILQMKLGDLGVDQL